ncbi:type II toxin-antitoxin system RelE/ParE family toxin [Hyalangium gracile]|uniref:type II toxin-antitoxin system RelE/ParE family toxin n=1 Tax=Hyalangium gracile TaxID=394092 RepID=UPI001CC9ED3A|nr:type II toxin-antitoxin system RelE/ParE family toxin [Hyalangium gracile]
MIARLHPSASLELDAAAEWYERRGSELGQDFIEEVRKALRVIAERPGTFPAWPGLNHTPPIHRFLLSRFPFALPYMVSDERVVVLAVAHLRRRPGYWLRRAWQLPPPR